jgi:hypothetical protein
MGNRSNINVVGNSTQGQNVGGGDACVFKCKPTGNVLQFRSISATGDSIQIFQTDDEILISGATGGGAGGSGFTIACNGLTSEGSTTVKWGGSLNENTIISGETYNLCMCNLGTTKIEACTGGNMLIGTQSGSQCLSLYGQHGVDIFGCGTDICVDAENITMCAGSTGAIRLTGGTAGIFLNNLPAKSSETCGVYIDSNGKLSTGVISSGTVISGTANYIPKFNATGNNIEDSLIRHGGASVDLGYETVNLGLSTTTGGNRYVKAAGTDSDIWLILCSKGNRSVGVFGNCGLQMGTPSNWLCYNGDCLYKVSYEDFCIHGSDNNNAGITACSLHLRGGDANNATSTGGDLVMCAGGNPLGTKGRVKMCNLPAKSSETCGIYIDASGNLSTGVISGGSAGGDSLGWSNLSNGSTVAGCGTVASGGTICNNTFFGVNAGKSITSGSGNTAIGFTVLSGITTGEFNVAIGNCVLPKNDSGCGNIGIGRSALSQNTTGNANIGIGCRALVANTTGSTNVAIGYVSLCSNTCGNCNVGIGFLTLAANQTGCDNVAIGRSALPNNIGGKYNIALGTALYGTSNGCDNFAAGRLAVYANSTGCGNIGVGNMSLYSNSTGKDNIALGCRSLYKTTVGNNIALGCYAGFAIVSGSDNIAIGACAYGASTVSSFGNTNIAIGVNSLRSNSGGTDNVSIGRCTLYSNSQGNCNIAISDRALLSNTTGYLNIAIGSQSLSDNTTGIFNIAIGHSALAKNTIGDENIAIGRQALQSCEVNGDACYNIAIGSIALYNAYCRDNIGIGFSTLYSTTTGSYNVAVGSCALYSIATTSNNTAIGYRALASNTGTGSVGIGYQAGYSCTASNILVIGNTNSTWLVFGCFSNNTICNAANSASWNTTSDSRIKENVVTIPCATNTLAQLNPVIFDYTENHSERMSWDCCKRICNYGFIAQEFEQVFPKYVTKSAEIVDDVEVEDFRSINDGHLVPLLVKAIQELEAKIQALELQINT